MGFPYHFVALDGEQESRRRDLLDHYAQSAQLSILLLPLIYQLSYGLWLLVGRSRSQREYQPGKQYQSPIVSNSISPVKTLPSSSWHRVRWALNEEFVEGWGTRQEWLIATLWTGWLLMLAVKDTGDGK
jgi:hypothetical protein